MNQSRIVFILFLLIVFLAGLYVYVTNGLMPKSKESFDSIEVSNTGTTNNSSCPNLLVRRGNVLMLFNTKAPKIDGVNPLPFYSLDEYINYVETQRNSGMVCPILYLQQENDLQGNDVYRVRPGPFDSMGGAPVTPYLDASRENGKYNQGTYLGFDPTSQYVGRYTEIDKTHDSTKIQNRSPNAATPALSDNPMDSNWGGVLFTQDKIDSGKYAENEITKPVFANAPNVYANTLPFKQVAE